MKRKLILLISTMLIWGSIFAQNHYTFNTHDYQLNMGIVAQIKINGVEQTSSNLELGAFKDESIRGSQRIGQYGSAGYYRVYIQIYGDPIETGYEIAFKLYNHETGEELGNYNITYLEEPLTVTWSAPNAIGTNRKPVVIDFTTSSSQTLTKEITGYGNGNGSWYLIASPFADDITPTTIGMITNDEGEGENATHTFDLYWFNQSEQLEWRNYRQGSFDLVNGTGYLYANKNDVTLTFTGAPIEGTTKEVPLVKDDNAEFPGWNLVGNPFAVGATSSQPYYRMNAEGSALKTETETTPVAAMEGVFVKATGDDQTVTFTAQTRGSEKRAVAALHISLSKLIEVKVPEPVEGPTQNNGVSTSSTTLTLDNAILRFDGGQTLEKFSFREGSTKLYIPQGGKDYAIVNVGRDAAHHVSTIPVNFKATEDGTYTITVNPDNVELAYLHLIDNMTGAEVDLLISPSYTFTANTTDYESRFKLVFSAIENADGDDDAPFAFVSNGNIIVNGEGTLQVVDMMGRIIVSGDAMNRVSTNGMTAGVYVLRLINGDDVRTQKIVIE